MNGRKVHIFIHLECYFVFAITNTFKSQWCSNMSIYMNDLGRVKRQ